MCIRDSVYSVWTYFADCRPLSWLRWRSSLLRHEAPTGYLYHSSFSHWLLVNFDISRESRKQFALLTRGWFYAATKRFSNDSRILGYHSQRVPDTTWYQTLHSRVYYMKLLNLINTKWLYPVSYTHLDVYKRQSLKGAIISLRGCPSGWWTQ